MTTPEKEILTPQTMGRRGGIARAKKLSKKRRLEISRLANEAKRLKKLSTVLLVSYCIPC